jgi:hypothetical protein
MPQAIDIDAYIASTLTDIKKHDSKCT